MVTQKFFSEYSNVFGRVEKLIQGIDFSDKKRLYTQKLFNRLMFIGFIQKKGWLTYNGDKDYLSALWKAYCKEQNKSSNFYRDRLSHLFFAGLNNSSGVNIIDINNGGFLKDLIGNVPFLNGGLFEQDEVDKESGIIVPDECIDSILHDLFQKFAFTVTESTPLDVEVAVDPEMLGKVFEELVTGRHESGSYYTPKPIVSFMCRESLKGYLKTQVAEESKEAIALLVDEQNPDNLNNSEAVLEAIKKVRTCDLACGSGAYLLGMLHELLDLRQRLESCIESVSPLSRGTKGDSVYQHKLEIIQNNLYGVDIDVFAVNIARLRLWLSLAVDYEGDKPQPLPNLKYKIDVGDSLITPNPTEFKLTDVLIEKFRQVKAEYIKTHDGNRKEVLAKEINKLKKEISLITYGNDKVNKFDWSLDFAEVFADGGFDVIVANPPYVRADAQFKHLEHDEQLRQSAIADYHIQRKKLKNLKIYNTLYQKWDLYIPFLERSYQILADKGQMIVIIPDSYNAANYTKKSHEFFLENTCVERIDFCSDLPIFKAGVSNTILYFSKSKPELNHKPIRVRHWGNKPEQFLENSEFLKTERQINFDISLFKEPKKTTHQINANTVSLSEIFYISWGLRPCSNEKTHRGLFKKKDLISNFQDSKHPKAYIEGKDTVKWWIKRIRYLEWNTERSPSLIARPTFPELYDVPEKIFAMDISGSEQRAAYDNKQLIYNNSVSCCVPWHFLQGVKNNSIKKSAKYSHELSIDQSSLPVLREELEQISKTFSIKYVLAIMNSGFAKDWLAQNRRSDKHIYPDDWKKLPIAIASEEKQKNLANLVDAVFAEFEQSNGSLSISSQQRIQDLEKEINDCVATLYGL